MQAVALLADKAFDADHRVIEPLLVAGKQFVIPLSAAIASPITLNGSCWIWRQVRRVCMERRA
jgi:hypothetical protein